MGDVSASINRIRQGLLLTAMVTTLAGVLAGRLRRLSEAAGEGADARGLAGLGGAIVDHADHDLAGVAVDDRHAGPAPFS